MGKDRDRRREKTKKKSYKKNAKVLNYIQKIEIITRVFKIISGCNHTLISNVCNVFSIKKLNTFKCWLKCSGPWLGHRYSGDVILPVWDQELAQTQEKQIFERPLHCNPLHGFGLFTSSVLRGQLTNTRYQKCEAILESYHVSFKMSFKQP